MTCRLVLKRGPMQPHSHTSGLLSIHTTPPPTIPEMYADADDGSLYNMDNPAVFRRFKKSASAACFHAAFFASVMNDSFVRLQLPCWDAPYFQADDSQKDQFAVGAGRGVPPNADPRPDPNPLILCSPSNFKAIRHVGTMTIDDMRDAAILAQGGAHLRF